MSIYKEQRKEVNGCYLKKSVGRRLYLKSVRGVVYISFCFSTDDLSVSRMEALV